MNEFKQNMINIFIPTFVLRGSSSSSSSNNLSPIGTGLLLGHLHHSLPECNIINLSITAILPYKCLPDHAASPSHWSSNNNSSYLFESIRQQQFIDQFNRTVFSSTLSLPTLKYLGELHYIDDNEDLDGRLQNGQLSPDRQRIVDEIRYECCHGEQDIFIDLDLQLNNRRYNRPNFDHDFVVKLHSINCFGKKIDKLNNVTLVYYDTENFITSQLLHRYNTDHNRVEFVHFLIDSLQSTASIYSQQRSEAKRRVKSSRKKKSTIDRLQQLGQHNPIQRLPSTIDEETNSPNLELTRSNWDFNSNNSINPSSSANLVPLMPRRLIKQFILSRSSSPSYDFASEPLASRLSIEPNPDRIFNYKPTDYRIINFVILQLILPLFNLISELVQEYLITKTMIGTQLKFRWLQLMIGGRFLWQYYWCSSSSRRPVTSVSNTETKSQSDSPSLIPSKRHSSLQSLGLGNVISSVAFDLSLGIVTTVLMHLYFCPSNWLQLALSYAETMVDKVDNLLRVLQGMPAGLKLNRPLNMALSQFFLYHIDLWKNFIQIIRPLFNFLMDSIFYCGIFGFTCILSLLSDLFSLVTIHIYCFYGYACRLYGHQISGISALWRLFRGKKWNQLRSRVDSYSYDNEQLFIGTILFTILLFLLPTVFMYYLVFLVLRILTLAVQEALFFFIDYLSSMPFYTLALWLFNSKLISGRVYFEMMDPQDLQDGDGPDEANNVEANHIAHQNNHHLDDRPLINGQLANHHNPAMDGHHWDNHFVHNNHHHPNNNHNLHNNNNNNNPVNNPHQNSPVIVQLKTDRISLSRIISTRYDDTLLQPLQCYRDSSTSAKQLSWTEFLHYILTGQVLQQSLSYGLSLSLFMCYILLLCYYIHHL